MKEDSRKHGQWSSIIIHGKEWHLYQHVGSISDRFSLALHLWHFLVCRGCQGKRGSAWNTGAALKRMERPLIQISSSCRILTVVFIYRYVSNVLLIITCIAPTRYVRAGHHFKNFNFVYCVWYEIHTCNNCSCLSLNVFLPYLMYDRILNVHCHLTEIILSFEIVKACQYW